MNPIDNQFILQHGNQEDDIQLEDLLSLEKAVSESIQQALKNIMIYSPDLEADLYNNDKMRKNLLNFARGNRYAKIQILCDDRSETSQKGHAFIQLAQQIPSSLLIRETPEDYQDMDCAFILIDRDQFIFKDNYLRYEAIDSTCSLRSKKLKETFDMIWQQAKQLDETRRFLI